MIDRHMNMTEVRLAGKDVNELLTGPDLRDALKAKEVDAVYKYDIVSQSRGGAIKEVHSMKGEFLTGTRPIGKSVITSATIDRDGDIVSTNGMIVTDAYKKNPIVLPMHQYREYPIGFTKQITQFANHATATWEWIVDQTATKADEYYHLWEAHVLNATSIGFVPQEFEWVEERWGIDFITWELLEHSIVTIPANPDAQRSIGSKQYIKLVGSKLIETSPIVRRGLEVALADGKMVSVKLPDEMKIDTSEIDDESILETAADAATGLLEAYGLKADIPAASDEQAEEGEKSFEQLLMAYVSGAMDEEAVLAVLNARFSKLVAERDLYRQQLAEMSLAIIESKTEV